MAKGNIILEIGGKSMSFARAVAEFEAGGDLNTKEMTLQYYNGNGSAVAANQILFSDGTIGVYDFFEIKCKNSTVLSLSGGYIDVYVSFQGFYTPGTAVDYDVVILGSDPFNFEITTT